MITGLGIDLVEVKRIRELTEKFGERFLKRVFSESELSYCFSHKDPFPHLAARFAAKEALVKATGSLELSFREISVESEGGAPLIKIQGKRCEDLLVSLSHTKDHAVAIVLKKGEGK